MTQTHRQVAGVVYDNGTPDTVVGFPIHQGTTTRAITFVDLLTDDGRIVDEVQVATTDLDGVRVKPLSGASDDMLWHIANQAVAQKAVDERATRCLAELAFRWTGRAEQQRRENARRAAIYRESAERLLAAKDHA